MTRKKLISTLAGLALASVAGLSQAGAISSGSWVGFCFGGVGSGATSGCQNDASQTSGNAFTFSLASSTLLQVTDAFDYGDVFSVYDFGTLLFTTNAVATLGGSVSNPDLAWADVGYSKGSYVLSAGLHSIEIFADASPFGAGGAYMNVGVSPVPEPSTYALMLAGLGLVGYATRRRKQKNAA